MAHALPAPCQYEAGNVDVEVKAGDGSPVTP
jgi:hypothetical protein